MLFDERRRAELLKKYDALPETERKLCRFLAVVYVPTAVTNLTKCLNASDIRTPGGIQWSAKAHVGPFLERWRQAGLADCVSERRTNCWYVDRLLAEPLAREARALGEFEPFDRAVEAVMHFARDESACPYSFSLSHLYRSFRNAFYEGDTERFQALFGRRYGSAVDCHAKGHSCDPLTDIVANPLSVEFLMNLPPDMAEHVFFGLLHNTMQDPETYREVADAFFAYCEKRDIPSRMRFRFAERLFMHGRVEEARAALEGQEDPDAYSLRAFIAFFLRGDEAEATALYEEGLKAIRKLTGKRAAAFVSWSSALYPVLLFKSGTETRKIAAYLDKAFEWGQDDFRPIPAMLELVLLPVRREDQEAVMNVPYIEDPRHSWAIFSFFGLLCAHWIELEWDGVLAETARTVIGLLDDLGLHYFKQELLAIHGDEGERPALPHPLGELLGQAIEWERSLSELQGIGGGAERPQPGSNRRLVWEIDWRESQDRVGALVVTPVEQTLQKKGWSKGRHVALRRLYRKADTVLSLTDQDHRVVAAVRESRDFYGTEYYLDVPQAVYALAGHPLLIRAGTGERVEVFQDEPRLSVRDAEEGYALKIDPFPDSETSSFVFSPDGPNRLRATRFEDRHLRMAEIVGSFFILIIQYALKKCFFGKVWPKYI